MSGINLAALKFTWRGQWQSAILYKKNDLVQYGNAAYLCIQDIVDEWKIAQDKTVMIQANQPSAGIPEIYFVDKRPDLEPQYFRLVVRGNTFKRGWMPHRVYTYGDVVRYGGDLYMYTGQPGSGASATATINGSGAVSAVTIVTGGSGYTIAPLVTFGFDSLRGSYGAAGYATVSNGVVTSVIITNAGTGYTTAPTVSLNFAAVRNTHPEDTTYWTRILQNPSRDTRRMYAVATVNQQPLGWTRNFGDWPNPQTNEGSTVSWIGADGVPYSNGSSGGSILTLNSGGRGLNTWVNSWQPSTFTFVDWLRSTDNTTGLGISGMPSPFLPTPDGLPPRCIQWIRNQWNSAWLFNNGEVYTAGYADANGQTGNSGTSTVLYTTRATNNTTTGFLGETLPRSFNQTKIIKLDCSSLGQTAGNVTANSSNNSSSSWYAVGSDGSLWSWGYNAYGQLGHGQATPGTGSAINNQILPTRIPAVYFDNKKIVDVMAFGMNYASVIALDEDGDLWGWGADYYGELGLGGQFGAANYRTIPTRIPFDFKRFGGIKKMSYCHYNASSVRFVIILTNDGSLFGAGGFAQAISPLTPTLATPAPLGITTATATSSGTVSTITFTAQSTIPFAVGQMITVAGVTPTGFNGTYMVTAATTTSVSFTNGTAGPQTVAGTVTGINQGFVNRFTKYSTTFAGIKQVDNVWVVGDALAPNIFIRERDTGLTYGMGDNTNMTINQNGNNWNQNGVMGPWSLIRGPRNIVMVTNNEAESASSTSAPWAYLTIMMLDENGRVWGQGRNNKGSLSLSWAGQTTGVAGTVFDSQMQNPETGGETLYWPVKAPSGVRIGTIMGQGINNNDLSSFVTDDGQLLYCGTDGVSQNSTTSTIQGSFEGRWANINASGGTTPQNRYTMHSLMGD